MESSDPLEQVKALVAQLSRADRSALLSFLASFHDSGIITYDPGLDLEALEKHGIRLGEPSNDPRTPLFQIVFVKDLVSIQLGKLSIACARFFPDNLIREYPAMRNVLGLAETSFKLHFPDDVKDYIREQLAAQNVAEADIESEMQGVVDRISKDFSVQWITEKGKRIAAGISRHFPGMVADMMENAVKGQTFYDSREAVLALGGDPDISIPLAPFKKFIQDQAWRDIRPHLGTIHGGARNVKHVWKDEERRCLAAQYERLQPIWIEAKNIAKAARKSREATRKREWKKAVLSVYPDLPDDLLDRYATPQADDAAPSKIAITHAARLCVPQVDLSPQRLKAQIKAWKVKQAS